jgi:hypothetical protein
VPIGNCASGDVKRNIMVKMAALIGAGIDGNTMTDTLERVEQHSYRFCDLELEVTERVNESFQRLGYFCADVGPIALQQTEKNQYEIRIHVHPGKKYQMGECIFTGATLLSADELKSALHMKRGSLFTTGSVRHGIENIQKSYAKKGHPQVTAIPVALVDEKNRRIVRLKSKFRNRSHRREFPVVVNRRLHVQNERALFSVRNRYDLTVSLPELQFGYTTKAPAYLTIAVPFAVWTTKSSVHELNSIMKRRSQWSFVVDFVLP